MATSEDNVRVLKHFTAITQIFDLESIVGSRIRTNAEWTSAGGTYIGEVTKIDVSTRSICVVREDGRKGGGENGEFLVSIDNREAFLSVIDQPKSIAEELGMGDIRTAIQSLTDSMKRQREEVLSESSSYLSARKSFWGQSIESRHIGRIGALYGVKVVEGPLGGCVQLTGADASEKTNKLTKKTMLRIPVGLRRLLDKELSVMYKAGFLNEDLTLSPRGMKELVVILLTANKTALAAEATRVIEEAKEDDCEC